MKIDSKMARERESEAEARTRKFLNEREDRHLMEWSLIEEFEGADNADIVL